VLAGIETDWGTGRLATVLAPSVASQPGVKDWYGRVERYAASPGTALAKMRAISELDVRRVLPLVAAPTLVVHNRDDWFIRVGHGRYLAEHIAGAHLLERDSADHWPIGDADALARSRFVVGSRSEDSDVDRYLATVLFVDGRLDRARERDRRSQQDAARAFRDDVDRV
jgi:hypothetical protein